jgi:hypothetical protein
MILALWFKGVSISAKPFACAYKNFNFVQNIFVKFYREKFYEKFEIESVVVQIGQF